MKIKLLALSALMTLAVTSAFAQNGMMSPSMDDQDYSDWRQTYYRLAATPAGAVSSQKAIMESVTFRDELDSMVFKKLAKMAMAEHRTPARPFDSPWPITSQNRDWERVSMKLNAYRRELIRENEARRMELDRSMGRSTSSSM